MAVPSATKNRGGERCPEMHQRKQGTLLGAQATVRVSEGARPRRLKKNATQIVTLLALGNLWMARRKLLAGLRQVRMQGAQCSKTWGKWPPHSARMGTERAIGLKRAGF